MQHQVGPIPLPARTQRLFRRGANGNSTPVLVPSGHNRLQLLVTTLLAYLYDQWTSTVAGTLAGGDTATLTIGTTDYEYTVLGALADAWEWTIGGTLVPGAVATLSLTGLSAYPYTVKGALKDKHTGTVGGTVVDGSMLKIEHGATLYEYTVVPGDTWATIVAGAAALAGADALWDITAVGDDVIAEAKTAGVAPDTMLIYFNGTGTGGGATCTQVHTTTGQDADTHATIATNIAALVPAGTWTATALSAVVSAAKVATGAVAASSLTWDAAGTLGGATVGTAHTVTGRAIDTPTQAAAGVAALASVDLRYAVTAVGATVVAVNRNAGATTTVVSAAATGTTTFTAVHDVDPGVTDWNVTCFFHRADPDAPNSRDVVRARACADIAFDLEGAVGPVCTVCPDVETWVEVQIADYAGAGDVVVLLSSWQEAQPWRAS
jgi:hypothetical protein